MQNQLIGQASFIVGFPVLHLETVFQEVNCDAECREKISLIVARSFNLWRHLCLRCGSGLFAFIVDGNWIYIDRTVFDSWNQHASIWQRLLNAHKAVLELDGSRPSGPRHVIGTYVRVTHAHPLIRELCSSKLGAFETLWPGTLKRASCGQSKSVPVFRIKFSSAPACDDSTLVGCATPEQGVEISVEGGKFFEIGGGQRLDLSKSQEIFFGDPSNPIDLHAVVLHEIGHFLGLDHLPPELQPSNLSSVMLPTYYSDFCVSITDTSLLNSAADASWEYRAKPCSGLKKPGLP